MIVGYHDDEFPYSHFISSGRWNTLSLAADQSRSRQKATVLEALNVWMDHNESSYVEYTDICQGTCLWYQVSCVISTPSHTSMRIDTLLYIHTCTNMHAHSHMHRHIYTLTHT